MLYDLKNIKKILKKDKNYKDKKELLRYIDEGIFKIEEDVLCKVLIIIINQNLSFDFIKVFEKLYNVIVYNKNDINLFLKAASFTKNVDIKTINNFESFYMLFKNKKLAIDIYKHFNLIDNYDDITLISYYIIKARKYYIDEKAFYFSIISVINEISKDNLNSEEIINNHLKEDKKIGGSYDYLQKLENLASTLEERKKRKEKNDNELKEIKDKIKVIKENEKLNRLLKLEKENKNKKINQSSEKKYYKITSNEKALVFDVVLASIKKEISNEDYLLVNTLKIDNRFKDALYNSVFIDENRTGEILLQDEIKNFLKFYYFSLYNDTLFMFHQIIKKVPISKLSLFNFEKEVVREFKGEEEFYINIISKANSVLKKFKEEKDMSTLKEIIKINPSFLNVEVYGFNYDKIKSATRFFGVEEVANSLETGFIKYINLDMRMNKVKKLLEINPLFYNMFNQLNPIFFEVFHEKEIASLNETQIKDAIKIFKDIQYSVPSLYKLSKERKSVIKKFVLNNIKYDNIVWKILNFKTGGYVDFPLDIFLLLNEEEINMLISEVKNYNLNRRSLKEYNRINKLVKKLVVNHDEKK